MYTVPRVTTLLLALLACTPAPSTDTAAADEPADTVAGVAPGCGDGVVDADEGCDDGAANSDSGADACRTDCFPARCGDAVVDAGEGCDDGGLLGGDGCSATCAVQTGTAAAEPDDAWDDATPAGDRVHGALADKDVDCWSFGAPACGAIEVVEEAPCGPALTLELHDPDGAVLATGAPGPDGCAVLDPLAEPGARWVAEGTWSVCVAAVNRATVPDYTLAISTPDPLAIGAPATGSDTDEDTVPDSCDTDLDGDGVDNEADNCPDVSNGPATPAPSLSADGFVRTWLQIGPFTTGVTTGECRPSDEALVGEDGPLAPALGDTVGELAWTWALLSTDAYDLLGPYGSVAAPREAYTLVYLESATARTLTLAVGADDGVFAWWNGAQVLDVASCQGVNTDQFQAEVAVEAGWNTLLVKVRDWGGGWGVIARLLDAGTPVTDLTPSLDPAGAWVLDQTDRDGDGVGDACDDTP